MTRIQPLPFDEWDLDAISAVAPGRQLGPSNVLGLFANHPALAKAFLRYNAYLLSRDSTIPPHARELRDDDTGPAVGSHGVERPFPERERGRTETRQAQSAYASYLDRPMK